jgi:hypothetical protein
MKSRLAVLAMLGALALGAPALAQPAGSASPAPTATASAEPAPPGVEITAPDFSNNKPEPDPPGFGDKRHYFDVLAPLPIPEDVHWAVPDAWTKGGAQLTWHSVGRWWVGGTGITSVGYAVRIPVSDAYWALDEDKIALFQVNNVLPKEMPKGAIGTNNLLLGYSLYILIGVVVGILAVGGLLGLMRPKTKTTA